MRWMEAAWAAEGVCETGGHAATPEIIQFFRDVGRDDITSDEVAWCAAFVGACLHRAGFRHTGSLMARSYLTYGTAIDTLRVGAIVVFRRGSDPSSGHVGFVVSWDETHIKVLSGNQSNSVCAQRYPRSQLLEGGIRWPVTAAAAAKHVGRVSRIAAGAAQQKQDGTKAASVSGAELVIPQPPPKLGLSELAGQASSMKGAAEQLEAFMLFAWGKGGWIAGALAAFWVARMMWTGGMIGSWRAEDTATGKTT